MKLLDYDALVKLYFASGNDHKRQEMSRLLGGYELTLPKDEGLEFDPEENGTTFVENAIIKAKALYDLVHQPVLADDSGLCVRALDWKPGIRTARYGEEEYGRKPTSKEQYTLLLKTLEGVEDRYAEFTCALCLYMGPNRIYVLQEAAPGEIALAPSGTAGFGYDPVFYSTDAGSIFADLPEGEKDNWSHRGKAARRMKDILDKGIEA